MPNCTLAQDHQLIGIFIQMSTQDFEALLIAMVDSFDISIFSPDDLWICLGSATALQLRVTGFLC